jgi:hypothetical protein
MENAQRTIGPLDKVTLKLSIPSTLDGSTFQSPEVEAHLIYGIGIEGITPFEKMIFAKKAGDQVQIAVSAGDQTALFGHLAPALLNPIRPVPPFTLNVTIVSIQGSEGREVVQAMARLVGGCGDGCDCGCGCG